LISFGSLERLAAQNIKPAFNLIKPGSVSGRKVQIHVGMALKPVVVLMLAGEIVEDDMNLLFLAEVSMMPFLKSRNSRRRRRL
jgi:hypothetical protein